MSGGSCLDLVLQPYKSLKFGFLAKQLPFRDVSEIGVFLNKYIPKKEIDWSINDLMILCLFIITTDWKKCIYYIISLFQCFYGEIWVIYWFGQVGSLWLWNISDLVTNYSLCSSYDIESKGRGSILILLIMQVSIKLNFG